MNIHLLLEKAEKEGLVNIAKFINENFEREEAVLLTTAVSNYLEKQATFLKIDISDEHKKMMVNCPLFGKMVHIDDVCYGCRFNPATGRFEGHDGEYFQCNYNPAIDTPAMGPATRSIQPPTKTAAEEDEIRTCDICEQEIGTVEEGGQRCDSCDRWICDDCMNWGASNGGLYCVECKPPTKTSSDEEMKKETQKLNLFDEDEEKAVAVEKYWPHPGKSEVYCSDCAGITMDLDMEEVAGEDMTFLSQDMIEEGTKCAGCGKKLASKKGIEKESQAAVEEAEDKLKKTAKMVSVRCNKCGETFKLDVGDMTQEQVEDKLGKQQGFQCPGHHVELDSPLNYWEIDWESMEEGAAPTEEEFLAQIKEQYDEVYTKQELDGAGIEITHFSYGFPFAKDKETGKEITLDFTHSPAGKRYYYVISREASSEKMEKESQAENQVTLPDEEDLSRFDLMSDSELNIQLKLYQELNEILSDAPAGENIKLQDTTRIIEYIEALMESAEGVTPQDLQEEEAVIEEVSPEEAEELAELMGSEYGLDEIMKVAESFKSRKIPLGLIEPKDFEKEATLLGFEKNTTLLKEAPAILDRCVRDVMDQNKGKEGFTKSNAYAICIDSLRGSHPEVEEWVHKKKSEVRMMDKIDEVKMSDLTYEDLEERLKTLNEMEFTVRSAMDLRSETSMAEGTQLLNKIAADKVVVKELMKTEMMIPEGKTPEDFEYDSETVMNIPHILTKEFKKVASDQAEIDWETFLDVGPQLLVEANKILQSWPALMAEAARHEILPKISALPAEKQQEYFLKFMDSVEKERKRVTGEKEPEKEEKIEKEASTEKPDPRRLFI